jgi:glycosyltransferase involved in cell wall biosynthesis
MITVDMRMVQNSGIGTYLKQLVPRVMKSTPQMQFRLLGDSSVLSKIEWPGNSILIDCKANIYSIKEQLALMKHIPSDTNLFWSPHMNIPLFYKGKLLVTIHDVSFLALNELYKGLHQRLYSNLMFRSVSRKADQILTVSNFTKQQFIQYTGHKESNITVTHLGVDSSWRDIAASPHWNERPYFLYVGNVKPHKNLKRLITAYQSIKEQIPQTLVIVGKKDGFIMNDPDMEAIANGSEQNIIFTGYVSDDELKQYYVNADGLVFPSLYEGFGLPPLEAMACGVPVLVSNAASLPEVCGDAALYCDPYSVDDIAKKLLVIGLENEPRNGLIEKGKKWVEQFTWDHCAKVTIESIEKIMIKETER